MRIVLSIDVAGEWAGPARWVLTQMLEALGFDLVGDGLPESRPCLIIRYGGETPSLPAGVGEVYIPAEAPLPPEDYQPPDDLIEAHLTGGDFLAEEAQSKTPVVPAAFDLVAPAWYFLSRKEEERGEKDELQRFLPGSSWQVRRGQHHRPLVDEMGRLLLTYIERAAGRAGIMGVRKLPWPGARPYAIALTHDQDQSIRWMRRIARRMVDLVRGDPRGRGAIFSLLGRHLREGAVPETILSDRLVDQQERVGIRSSFFFLPVRHDRFGRRYNIHSPSFQKLLERLARGGHGVGLHASLEAAQSADQLRREKEVIEGALGSEVSGVRHHYLRASFPETWYHQEEAGFRWDASLGYPDHPGLRSGSSFPFRPEGSDHFLSFPLTGMDRALLAEGLTTMKRWSEWSEPVKKVGGLLDILWHPYFTESVEGDGREELTRTLLEWVASQAGHAWVATLEDVALWWEERRALHLAGVDSDGHRTLLRYRCGSAIRSAGLTPVPPQSDMRMEESTGGKKSEIAGSDDNPHMITGDLERGSEMIISLAPRHRQE